MQTLMQNKYVLTVWTLVSEELGWELTVYASFEGEEEIRGDGHTIKNVLVDKSLIVELFPLRFCERKLISFSHHLAEKEHK